MSKTIRPLAAYKKENSEIYKKLSTLSKASSLKAKENDFYFFYAAYSLGVESIKEILHPTQIELINSIKNKLDLTEEEQEKEINFIKRGTQHLIKTEYNSFFFNEQGEDVNKGTVSEIGRLLLYGWYYNIYEWAQNVGMYIYKAYKKTESAGEAFNDLEFKDAVKYIRENIGYYYHNEPELKLYILETFFNEKLQALLPEKPKELQSYEETIDFILEIRKNQKKKGIDSWINEAENYERYSFYLADILEDYNLEFLSFEDYNTKEDEETKEWSKNIEKLKADYKAQYIDKVKKIDLT
jgi:hypothetical protein